jgi:hypothetical protein
MLAKADHSMLEHKNEINRAAKQKQLTIELIEGGEPTDAACDKPSAAVLRLF